MYSVALSGLSFVNALVPGVLPFGQAQADNTPVCGLSSLRDFRVSPHEMLLSRKPNYRRISRGALDFPRTAITSNTCSHAEGGVDE